ncbi:unnamed protein product [Moneuplotes crassus]|uniref:Uncharacterized protein n=1 Tax=Euplotes crassus TaxID=5936 RepID=A0AAD1UM77_EUPCR|nr:unnamed protein product [Moneuplotes crassus]
MISSKQAFVKTKAAFLLKVKPQLKQKSTLTQCICRHFSSNGSTGYEDPEITQMSKVYDQQDAAEAYPVSNSINEKVLRELTEHQRIEELRKELEPVKLLNITGIFPEVAAIAASELLEDKSLNEDGSRYMSRNSEIDSNSDQLLISEQEAQKIITEMQKETNE